MKEFTTLQALLKPLSKDLIAAAVSRFNSDYYSKSFKTWDHLIAMIYVQVHELKSLRDLEIAFNSQKEFKSLIGVKELARSTLSDANERRSPQCFLWMAEQLMSLMPRKVRKEVNKVVRKLDSTPIQLKGKGYDEWTLKDRTLRCQGLKLHVEYDGQLDMPTRFQISKANVDDCKMGQSWPILPDTIYVYDKGYYDFNWWWQINQQRAFYVTRLKYNAVVKIEKNLPIKSEKILEDSLVTFKNKCPRGGKRNLYSQQLRRIVVKREGKEKPLIIVSNLIEVPAEILAELYKERWGIELFFKWIKQNLKIKKFLGKSENAVKTQMAIALIVFLLIGIFKLMLKNPLSLHQLLIWVRHNLKLKRKIYSKLKIPKYQFIRIKFMLYQQGGQL
jgi:putative transposase